MAQKIYTFDDTSPLGPLTMASDGEKIIGLWLIGQKYFAATLGGAAIYEDLPIFRQARAWLASYFAGKNPPPTIPLAPSGSPFRQEVWRILTGIPAGQVMTYGQIAKLMAKFTGRATMSAQAVGGAVGHNPISILIPCHRVVGAGGNLTGYAGGLEIKIKLLELEGLDMSQFHRPAQGTAL